MVKLAECNIANFGNITSFSQITEDILREKLNNVIFYDVNNTLDMYKKINDVLYCGDPNKLIDIANCYYDNKILIQAFYIDDSNKQILVKRKINPNDSYTFMDFKFSENPSEICDPYELLDITIEDIMNLIIRQYSYCAVLVRTNLTEENIEIILNTTADIVGNIEIKNDNIIKYMNMRNWLNQNNFDNENADPDKLEEELHKYIYNNGIQYMYSKHNTPIGMFNLIAPITSTEKNHKLSHILNQDVFGDCYLWLEENSESSQEHMTLRLDIELFNKIAHDKCSIDKRKNKLFYNIYYESME